MRFDTLERWLAWQEGLHPTAIDLGLERVTEVARRLGVREPRHASITVAGTNGKGSCAMLLEACLRAAGHRVGTYTSPHLHHYRERIRVDGAEVTDAALVQAFARIDEARTEISLTFFEFGTLAALLVFEAQAVEVAVLEVGLGGRLDAVNLVDADAALIASVGVDHVEWLGGDRESIGREKAGVLRGDRPAVYAEPDPPQSVLAHAAGTGCPLARLGVDYHFRDADGDWDWWPAEGEGLRGLPRPSLPGPRQLQNAAAVLALLARLDGRLPVGEAALRAGLAGASLAGRLELLPGAVPVIVDVAHNPQAAAALAEHLQATAAGGRTLACAGMLADKDAEGCAAALAGVVDGWYAGGLGGPRGQTGAALAARLRAVCGVHGRLRAFDDVAGALRAAKADAVPGDRVVAFGSFVTAALVRALESGPARPDTAGHG